MERTRSKRQMQEILDGWSEASDLSPRELRDLRDLRNGTLLRQLNEATMAYGHGRLHCEDGSTLDIGGSTGGLTRHVLDHYVPPDNEQMESFL